MGLRILLTIHILACFFSAYGQGSIRDSSIAATMISASFGLHIPKGDLADRFGTNMAIGGHLHHKTAGNLIFGLDASFFFGKTVKEDSILDGLRIQQGSIININGEPAVVILSERGFSTNFCVGKQFSWIGPNPNSGIFFTLGAGYFQHKIRIDVSSDTPQLNPEYRKGYDRLSAGINVTQSVGYRHLSGKRLINFFAALEATEAFTQNIRPYNFDTMMRDDSKRLDALVGVRVGWLFLLYKRAPKDFYYD